MHEGIYEKLINKTLKNRLKELNEADYFIDIDRLDGAEAKTYLSNYISKVTENALMIVRDEEKNDKQKVLQQIRLCNEIIEVLDAQLNAHEFKNLKLDEKGEILTAIYHKLNNVISLKDKKIVRPETSVSQNYLFTSSHLEPNMLEELKREILTSDEILWLVSFIKWTGIRNLIDALREFTNRGGKLRVITTSYMEATDYKAVEELGKLSNTKIKVSLNKKSTRLHAKAYLFKRKTGFSSAYIGSSNISNSALTAGLEWNMKVTERESFNIVQKFVATFESYWNDPEFVSLSNGHEHNWGLFKESLQPEKYKTEISSYFFDIRPYHYQQEILDELEAERTIHQRNKNLVVAATGVGKTIISAFDFKRYYQKNPRAKLLFVAHREEILKQSINAFRMILKDENFGDLLVGQYEPEALEHLFVSIQSWNSRKMDTITSKAHYDFIIIDEFHHAAAPSYKRLLTYYEPDILLGLTATPERMDNESILHYFDGNIASEMRLKEAIDRNLLVPFHYYCVTDNVDLSGLKWTRKGYDLEQLSNLYTANDRRSDLIIRSIKKYVTDIDEVRGLGFCVSVQHAQYMATYFDRNGIPSIALHGHTSREDRNQAQSKLKKGQLTFIFVVDLYNEGVDIPEVNTILFLRPTESLTVFLQQLGRGLRLSEGKECLTVLDFIGQAHKDYPFEEKFRALVGPTRKSIRDYVEQGFLHLPKGSVIHMEKQAREYILRNVKALKHHKQYLISKLKTFSTDSNQPLTLKNFLKFHHLTLAEFYGRGKNRTFERMKVEAGLAKDFSSQYEVMVMKQIHKLFYLDSISFIDFSLTYLKEGPEAIITESHKRKIAMLYYSLFNDAPTKFGFSTMNQALEDMLKEERLKNEIIEVLEICKENVHYVEKNNPFAYESPLRVHAHYTTDQVMAAFGYYNDEKKPAFREGVKHFPEYKTDIFFITLNKSEKYFSPTTQYEDYAISDTLFHWQSQSQVSQTSPTAKRYINHKVSNNKIALFVREYRQKDGYASPFVFLGTVDYVSHEGNRPVSFVWKLHEPLPAFLVPEAKKGII